MKKATLITSDEALVRRVNFKGHVADDTLLMTDCLIALLAHAEKNARPKRKPSEYQKYVGKRMRAGLSIKDAAAEWKGKKR